MVLKIYKEKLDLRKVASEFVSILFVYLVISNITTFNITELISASYLNDFLC